MHFTVGSLFDGSGGFPLAAFMCGGSPVLASEVEPYPIAVTRSRFPYMKHLGDITKINGAEIEPVGVITFGSPCQDMSVAGKRAGIKHEENGDEETTRSGLFMEAVRIIKEMREKTNGEYPRFAVWENVPGAFSSNKGEDLRLVLEEIIKIVEPTAVMPDVPKGGWAYADSYRGDGWSIAYRVLDAQYWGVPQRRRRIYLVADFRGERAQEILFKRDGLQGYFAPSREAWQGTPEYVEGSPLADDREGGVCFGISPYESNAMKSSNPYSGIYEADTSRTLDLNGGNPACNQGGIAVVERVYSVENHPADSRVNIDESGTVQTLTSRMGTGGGNVPMVMTPESKVIAFDRAAYNQGENAQYDFEVTDSGVNSTIVAKGPSGVCYGVDAWNGSETPESIGALRSSAAHNINSNNTVRQHYIVRRLTPTECARLQGFPDRWGDIDPKSDFTDEEYQFWLDVRKTDDRIKGKAEKDYTKKQILSWYNKLHTDSAEYKMWGNGIAFPCALYVMQGISEVMHESN